MGKTTITDIPREGNGKDDKFGLIAYEQGLETFLRGASTPITVALQGEWGSGKTSLMNVLKNDLCGDNKSSGEFFSVWINTWEYSLMREPSEALLQILIKMANELTLLSQNAGEDTVNSIKIKKCLKIFGLAVTRSLANKVVDGAYDRIVEDLGKEEENSIADLRFNLQKQIDECLEKNKGRKKGVIFFIDDLDRIDPPVAVELLELLKNIFTLKHCIFILAIDYDVVIKGLKPKFGELNDKNEREFRSFFDKIIQVPFSMPVSQYSTKDYLIDELKSIGVLDTKILDDDFVEKINKAEILSVGSNPRSIKRFLNTLSLIKCIEVEKIKMNSADKEQDKEDEIEQKFNILLNLAIVGIQVAYPKVYQLLCIEPGFTLWNEKIASKMGIPRIDEQTENRLSEFSEFDEPWEQVLYRLCLTDKYLQNNALNISQLLNMIREEIKKVHSNKIKDENWDEDGKVSEAEMIKTIIINQISQVAITGITAGDTVSHNYENKELRGKLLDILYEHISSKWKGKKFSKKAKGEIQVEGDCPNLVIQEINTENQKICFKFLIGSKRFPQNSGSLFRPKVSSDKYQSENIEKLRNEIDLSDFSDFFKKCEELKSNNCYKLWAERRIQSNGELHFRFYFDVKFDEPDAFLKEENIVIIKDVIYILYNTIFKLNE